MEEREDEFTVFAVPGPPIIVSLEWWGKRPKLSKEEWERRMKEIHENAKLIHRNNEIESGDKPKTYVKKNS